MRKVVRGEVKEVKVGVVNTHLATWYSETEEKWSQVREGVRKRPVFVVFDYEGVRAPPPLCSPVGK